MAAFTRQHYVAIARIVSASTLRTESGATDTIHKPELVSELAKLFADDNERFDEERFIDACYRK